MGSTSIPGETIELKPLGRHLMVMGAASEFKDGQTLPIKLNFKNAGSIEVSFAVKAGGPPASHVH
jgi:copper(I)-binding protein